MLTSSNVLSMQFLLIVCIATRIKWTCPTSPSQPLTLFSGFPSNAWFDVSSDLSEDAKHDVAGLDASAAHVLSLLSTEPEDVLKADWRHQLHQTPYVFVKLFKGSDDNET
ncbi:acyl-protein thioesterase 2-like protein [Tanacetum coccineum]